MCFVYFFFLFLFSVVLFILFLYSVLHDYSIFMEWEIVNFNSLNVVMTFLLDWMSLLFLSFVLLISSLVIFYSEEYMKSDKYINRFIMLIMLFVFSMMFLIVSPNLISILLGWDGLGLTSYCLVIYFKNSKSYNAGMLTVLSNRIGDVFLLMSIAWMMNYGSWNYIYYLEFMLNDLYMNMICLLVVLGAMTKSAQIPFSSWLPAAMAAPTPVSALVHSSTLVTAGIYLMIRFNILLENFYFNNLLFLIACLTMFMSGLGANFEFDLKKIIALSTLSQLGFMLMILSMGYYKLAFFHLLMHALFKALLFMCAGCIIHNMNNLQDLRFMGSLSIYMPLTATCFNVANLSLCGMPFLCGFYSKDLILEMYFMNNLNVFMFILMIISIGLTVCYSFRLVYYFMIGDLNCSSLNMVDDMSWVMIKSMLLLTFMSIFMGSLISWLIFDTPHFICLPWNLKYMILLICVIGGLTGYMISNVSLFFINKSKSLYNFNYFFSSMWFLPYISTYGVVYYPLSFGFIIMKNIDQGWSEYLGSYNLYNKMMMISKFIYMAHMNNLKIYFVLFLVWISVLLLLFMI
nr:NADH dehydrogenase subunit 5 [Aristosyrphus sp.]